LVRWLPLVMGVLYAAAVTLYAIFGLHARGSLVDAVISIIILASACAPLGAILGYAGRRLIEKNGGSGGGAFGVMVLGGGIAWVATGMFMSAHPIDPQDIGFITTGWVWDRLGWGGSLLYLLSVPFDLIVIVLYLLFAALAIVVAPPASFLCTAFAVFLFLAPVLLLLRRRRERAA